jgi:hypothetical protein
MKKKGLQTVPLKNAFQDWTSPQGLEKAPTSEEARSEAAAKQPIEAEDEEVVIQLFRLLEIFLKLFSKLML